MLDLAIFWRIFKQSDLEPSGVGGLSASGRREREVERGRRRWMEVDRAAAQTGFFGGPGELSGCLGSISADRRNTFIERCQDEFAKQKENLTLYCGHFPTHLLVTLSLGNRPVSDLLCLGGHNL